MTKLIGIRLTMEIGIVLSTRRRICNFNQTRWSRSFKQFIITLTLKLLLYCPVSFLANSYHFQTPAVCHLSHGPGRSLLFGSLAVLSQVGTSGGKDTDSQNSRFMALPIARTATGTPLEAFVQYCTRNRTPFTVIVLTGTPTTRRCHMVATLPVACGK
jgi:hypothetical protein